jgi:RNA polymerase sigma-70 factor (ECF subfamily)
VTDHEIVTDHEFERESLPYRSLIYRVAMRATRSGSDADDVVQETYLLALQGWRRSRPEQVRPWLIAICLNVLRSRYRRRRGLVEELQPYPGQAVPSLLDTAEEALSRLTGAAVRTALRQLPPAQREAIVLMDICGLSAAAVGRLLGAPRGTVLARVHRGHRRLAELLRRSQRPGTGTLPAARVLS